MTMPGDERGWREWRRGYSDADVASVIGKIIGCKPGEVVFISDRELTAAMAPEVTAALTEHRRVR